MTSSNKAKYHLKIIVCGTGAVGKTSIVRRFVEGKFEHRYLMTVGMEPSNRFIEIDGIKVNLLIYDVAGQKRFETMRDIFFRGANGGLLVFDLTRSEETIDELQEWKEQIDQRVEGIPLILVGNKVDLEDQINIERKLVEEEIKEKLGTLDYVETSASKDKNIDKIFIDLTKEILKRQGI
ncbi:MAG: Rab family GTPase [Candidatus Hodarchaeales archaeon]